MYGSELRHKGMALSRERDEDITQTVDYFKQGASNPRIPRGQAGHISESGVAICRVQETALRAVHRSQWVAVEFGNTPSTRLGRTDDASP